MVESHVQARGREPRTLSSTSSSTRVSAAASCTDAKRLQQVLKNLLSNAFKFTSQGGVRLTRRARRRRAGPRRTPCSSQAGSVVAFEVSDTGIGIPPDKQRIIFEAFQQADASTSRKYGGTGLGLAISRELSGLLGGEIQLRSTPGVGSTFTLYLPLQYAGPSVARNAAGQADTAAAGLPHRAATAAAGRATRRNRADDRASLRPGEPIPAHRRGRPALRPDPCATWPATGD